MKDCFMNQEVQDRSIENIQNELSSLEQQYHTAINAELDLLRLKELRFRIKQAQEKLRHVIRRAQSSKLPFTPIV